MRRSLCLVALLAAGLLAAAPASAAGDHGASEKDPIDAKLDACLASEDGQTTQGMVECLDAAYRAWDGALNAAYQALSKALDPASFDLLKASQKKWLAFRDAEQAFMRGPWTEDRGTLIRVTLNQANVEMVRARVLQLRGYLEP